tara:strand:+ start:551 stop:877 length:327 start_codon:yes stop_codon:yes gene_type:complete
MKWDDRKGKYVKPFTKRIEIMKYLFIEGIPFWTPFKIYWDIPSDEYGNIKTFDIELIPMDENFETTLEKEMLHEIKYQLPFLLQKQMNWVLDKLFYIPLTGLTLGVII